MKMKQRRRKEEEEEDSSLEQDNNLEQDNLELPMVLFNLVQFGSLAATAITSAT